MDENGNVMSQEDDECQEKDGFYDSDKPPTTILDLPRQVWLKIQDFLDYSTYLSLRQTCSQFHTLVDTYLGHTATFGNFDKRPEAFKFYTSVALNDVQFDDASDPEEYSLSRIICDPGCLTDVSFAGVTNLPFLQDIITKCHRIQMVEMTMTCKIVEATARTNEDEKTDEETISLHKVVLPDIDIRSVVPPSQCHLRFAECLKLVPGIQSDKNLRSHFVLSLLRSVKSGRHLRKVIFQCELDEEITLSRVLRVTAEVMERHPNLEALFVALLNDEYLLPEGEVQEFAHYMDLESSPESSSEEVKYFRDRIVATGEYLKITKMGLAMLNANMQLIWGDFLKTQHHLVHLSLTVNIREGTFSQNLFNSFCSTIEQLAIRGKFEVPFDFSHVANCHNLKEICLHNLQENGGGGITPKCVNLSQVPEGLEGLILFQVVTRTEEIQSVVRKLDKLSTLVVFKCGHAAGETGVGLSCLQTILHKRSLNSTLMVQFICGSTSEAENLAGILYEMSLDVENQANNLSRLRQRLRQQGQLDNIEQVPAPGQIENILHLPEIQGDDDEDVLFAIQGEGRLAPAIQPRPVSRGNHRNVDQLEEENNNSIDNDQESADPNEGQDFPPLPPPAQENPLHVLHNILEQVLVDNNNNNPHRQLQQQQQQNGNDNNDNNEDNANDFDVFDNNLHFDNVHFNEMDEDVELIFDVGEQDINGPMLDLFAAERLARQHNVQVGFILDGVIDIINEEVVRSKWLCMEDSNGQITYTLKISVEL